MFILVFFGPFCSGRNSLHIGPIKLVPAPIDRVRRELSIGAGTSLIGPI